MRHAFGKDEYIAFRDPLRLPASDFAAARFANRRNFRIDDFAAGDYHCRAFEKVVDIGLMRVHFGEPRLVATTCVHFVGARCEQRGIGAKTGGDFIVAEIRDRGRRFARTCRPCHTSLQSSRAGEREFFVLLRALSADAADDLAIDGQRNAALERRESLHIAQDGDHGRAAFVDCVFECFGRLFEQRRGARLADGNVGAGRKRVIEALDGNQIAAVIDDGNGGARRVQAFGFGYRGGDYTVRATEGQRFLSTVCAGCSP